MKTLPRPLLLLAFVAACGGDAPAPVEAPRYAGEVELSLGEMEGPQEYTFGRLSGLALGPEGRIFAADVQAHEIRVFDEAGTFLFRIGRKGAGPGELDSPCCIAFDPEGLLRVRDNGNGRYVSYQVGDRAAEPMGVLRFQHNDGNFWAPLTFDGAGRLVDVGHRTAEGGGFRPTRFHVSDAGEVVQAEELSDPVGTGRGNPYAVSRGDGATFFLYQPYGPLQISAHAPGGGWAEASSASYEVAWTLADGRRITVARPEVVGPALAEDERARAEERIEGMLRQFELSRGQLPFGVPERKPPLRDLWFDQEGRLWVELSVAAGAPRVAEVWAPSGELAAATAWPADITFAPPVGLAGGDVALGVRRDSLGVERIVKLRFSPVADASGEGFGGLGLAEPGIVRPP